MLGSDQDLGQDQLTEYAATTGLAEGMRLVEDD